MSSVKAIQLEKQFINNVGELFKYLDSLTVPSTVPIVKSSKTDRESANLSAGSSISSSPSSPSLSQSLLNSNSLSSNSSILGSPQQSLSSTQSSIIPPHLNFQKKEKSTSNLKVESHAFKNAKDKNNVLTSVFFLFQEQLSPCFNALNHMRTVKSMSMAEIFRERMIKTKNLLTETKLQHYLSLLHYYLRMIDLLNIEKQKIFINISQQLVGYITSYTIDCDNCIVGLIPNDDLLNKLARDYEFLKLVETKDKNNNIGETLIEEMQSYQSTSISTTREQLLVNIINWSALTDNIQLSKAVRRYASILRGVDKLKRGDIVIVRFPSEVKKNFIGFKSTTSLHKDTNSMNSNSSSGGGINDTSIISNISLSNGSSNGGSSGLSGSNSSNNLNTKTRPYQITIQEYLDRRHYQPKAIFARFTGERNNYNINVWLTTEENEYLTIGIEDILPLNRSTIEALKDIKMIEKLVHQPTEKFFSQVLEESKQHTINHLVSLGIDMDAHLGAEKVSLFDLEKLKSMHSILHQLYTNQDHQFYKELEVLMNEKIEHHLNQFDHRLFFMPKYESHISDLKGSHHIALARSKIKQFLGDCELMLDQLKIEKRDLMNGTLKDEMTEWWLKRVEVRTSEFLSERGYNFTAVPENYIEQQPLNMKDVVNNLILIQKVMDPNEHVIEIITIEESPSPSTSTNNLATLSTSNGSVSNNNNSTEMTISVNDLSSSTEESSKQQDSSSTTTTTNQVDQTTTTAAPTTPPTTTTTTRPSTPTLLNIERPTLTLSNKFLNSPVNLIKELREEIYPIIDNFIKKAHIVLCEHFNIDIAEFNVEKVSAMLAETRDATDPQITVWIEDMLSDLGYLSEMKRLEDSKTEKSLHIVPIGGLVMGTFARLENELNTVVELWDNPSDESSEDISEVLDASMTSTQVFKVTQKRKPKTLNDEKSELHLAVSSEQLESVEKVLEYGEHLINEIDVNGWTPLHSAAYSGNADICKVLLNVTGVDVTIKNRDGASILHYLARHPLTEKRREVILLLLQHGLDINNGSRHCETPLHSAAFRGNDDVCKLLLQNGANVNALTKGGETALHYAVTAGRPAVVSTLLLAGALINISSKRGTPLEIATNAKIPTIISILENGPTEDNFSWRKNNKFQLQQIQQQQIQQQQSQQQQQQQQTTLSSSPTNNNNIANNIILKPTKRICKIEIGSRNRATTTTS
ncbi:hypothetical protein PPL_05770 [Heterostelium album PN500]|uniref:Ankyrin repeat-containing protein n=1 Tax=Heterostelium pallidum (strain ATCC 26659 / Pp 5 / PN500) TaxID=670386 RepID=D3BB38_HETP5|nr:hypothetical protein PPL_05770 [Heterostelium album PN500]EFA81775.1 hypothetical protein PPL_05770 [Heterostelium album PN500]|eukprot:XP_020433892.1 hypothetical protein PPL_05770 [Heterostelium album PN500]